MRLGDYLVLAGRRLHKAGADSPRLCAQALAEAALGLSRLECVLAAQRELTAGELAVLDALMDRRATGEPLAYITGHKEFYGLDFLVAPQTLIPRPETELLVDAALELLPDPHTALRFADLGAGCGCIGLTLAHSRPLWRGLALDLSAAALAVAQANALRLGLADRVRPVRADLFAAPLQPESCGLVVSNPPYVAAAERPQVMQTVLRFEPHTALFSPENGLAPLRAVALAAARALRPGGFVLLEHGAAQGPCVQALLREAGFAAPATRQDLAGLDRCTYGQKGIG